MLEPTARVQWTKFSKLSQSQHMQEIEAYSCQHSISNLRFGPIGTKGMHLPRYKIIFLLP